MSDKIMFVVVLHPSDIDDESIREELVLCGKGEEISATLLGGDTPNLDAVVTTVLAQTYSLSPGMYVGDVDSASSLTNVRPATDAEILSIGRGINPL